MKKEDSVMQNVSYIYTERHKMHHINNENQLRYLANLSYERGKKHAYRNIAIACLLCAFMGFMAGRAYAYAQTIELNLAGHELPVKVKPVDMGLPNE